MINCASCRFHQAHGKTEDGVAFGFCYRYPPVALSTTQSTLSAVNSDKGWCGEFKRKPSRSKK